MTLAAAFNAFAIGLAVTGAACFALAAVLQHRAVDAVTPTSGGALGMVGLRALVRRRGWLVGLALAVGGSGLHAVALILAPVSVVQPVGVLAVPFAVLLAVRRTRRRPATGVLVGVALSVAGVVAFVVIAATNAVARPIPDYATVIAGGSATLLVLVLAVVAALTSGWIRCVACAVAGAVAFGLGSTLVRAVSQQVTSGLAGLVEPRVLATVAGIGVALLVGGWLVQQGFAAGPPEVVIACLTVVDPIVAVALGVLVLGEGAAATPPVLLLLACCAVSAVAGVFSLASYHPDTADRSAVSQGAAADVAPPRKDRWLRTR